MTHFVVTVILPKGQEPQSEAEAQDFVAPLIAAYDENTEVEPYEEVCSCTRYVEIETQKCGECKGTGIYVSTYNPKSRWDWWCVGGRWSGDFNEGRDIVQIRAAKPDSIHSHIVTPDGIWHARGKNGWWARFEPAMSDEEWDERVKGICAEHLDHYAVWIDCHI